MIIDKRFGWTFRRSLKMYSNSQTKLLKVGGVLNVGTKLKKKPTENIDLC